MNKHVYTAHIISLAGGIGGRPIIAAKSGSLNVEAEATLQHRSWSDSERSNFGLARSTTFNHIVSIVVNMRKKHF